MAGAGRSLKNALAVAASAACLSRSRRSRVTDKAPASQRLKQDCCVPARKWRFLRGNRPKGGPKGRARWRAGQALRASRAERTQVHERQKAPSDAAGTQQAGFDGSSRQIRGLQGLELDASALADRGRRGRCGAGRARHARRRASPGAKKRNAPPESQRQRVPSGRDLTVRTKSLFPFGATGSPPLLQPAPKPGAASGRRQKPPGVRNGA